MIEYFRQGGIFMWPILLGSIWAFTLIFERMLFYKSSVSKFRKQSDDYIKAVKAEGLPPLNARLQGKTGFIQELMLAAWEQPEGNMNQAERRVEEVLHTHMPKLDRHLSTINMLAGIQPLLGLLGTITGMIATFAVISSQGTGDPNALADGISEAMITTQAGLVAAVPILIGHNFLRNRFRNVLFEIKAICARALNERENYVFRKSH
jgi:biopolymer transport protein ExbB